MPTRIVCSKILPHRVAAHSGTWSWADATPSQRPRTLPQTPSPNQPSTSPSSSPASTPWALMRKMSSPFLVQIPRTSKSYSSISPSSISHCRGKTIQLKFLQSDCKHVKLLKNPNSLYHCNSQAHTRSAKRAARAFKRGCTTKETQVAQIHLWRDPTSQSCSTDALKTATAM